MTLQDLGYTDSLESYRKKNQLDAFGVARVVLEHKERYVVKTAEQEYEGEIIGNLRFTAESRADFPAVGDWVAISEYDDKVLIHSIYPRKTVLQRQAAGKQGEKQIIATNIDSAFVVQAVDRDFNINRLERYLTLCHASKVAPIVLLNKTDLIPEPEVIELMTAVKERVKNIPVLAISNASGKGIARVKAHLEKGKTYCLLGSSGVGKSSLLNTLAGKAHMDTGRISTSTEKGRHVTSHRELVVLEGGGILIDNPGMREVGIADASEGLERTFEALLEQGTHCRFADCTHTTETGCAVIEAVERGEVDPDAYENYLKMEREKEHFESTVAERRQKEKEFGKIVKHYKNVKKHKH